MKRALPFLLLTLLIKVSVCQESTKDKVKPIVLNYLKTVPQLKGSEVTSIEINSVSLIDEKEKNSHFFNFYNSFRLNQVEQIELIKLSAEAIVREGKYNSLTRKDFDKRIVEIKKVLQTKVPLIDSLWTLEEKYKNPQSNGNTQEYYFVTFTFTTLTSGTKLTNEDYKMILTKELKVLLYDFM